MSRASHHFCADSAVSLMNGSSAVVARSPTAAAQLQLDVLLSHWGRGKPRARSVPSLHPVPKWTPRSGFRSKPLRLVSRIQVFTWRLKGRLGLTCERGETGCILQTLFGVRNREQTLFVRARLCSRNACRINLFYIIRKNCFHSLSQLLGKLYFGGLIDLLYHYGALGQPKM